MKKRKAQVAIIALLISALVMTVGLTLSRKTTIETRLDTNEEALRDAFNAAESGIDYYLKTGTTAYTVPDLSAKADVSVKNLGGEATLNFGEYTPEGGSEFYWLTNRNSDGSLGTSYYSGNQITVAHGGMNGSLAINIFYRSGSGFGVRRWGYNFSSDSNRQVSGFTAATGAQNVTITSLPSSPVLMTVTPIFTGANLSITGNNNFPAQGEEISSLGKVGEVNTTQANKKVVIQRRYKLPTFWLDALVAEGNIE